MDELVSLCARRGFVFQSGELYGGINGFWDYGPLGVELQSRRILDEQLTLPGGEGKLLAFGRRDGRRG